MSKRNINIFRSTSSQSLSALQKKKRRQTNGSTKSDSAVPGIKDERRARSSVDVRDDDGTESDSGLHTTTSKKKRFWSNIRKGAKKLRPKSRNLDQEQSTFSAPESLDDEHAERTARSASRRTLLRTQSDKSEDSAGARENVDGGAVREGAPAAVGNGPAAMHDEVFEPETTGVEDVTRMVTVQDAESALGKQRVALLRSYPFFHLDVLLKEGKDLVVRDSNGTSDPYVKFKLAAKLLYRSRIMYKNLNPRWNEKFTIPVEDPFKTINVKVFDYDRAMQDDGMGTAELDLTKCVLNSPTEIKLELSDPKSKEDYMGYLTLICTLCPKSQDEKEQFFNKTMKISEQAKKLKSQIWNSVVTIVLVEGNKLLPMDDNGLSDPFVKFKLGNEKYKSKYKQKTLNPKWCEQFDLYMYDEQSTLLEIMVYDYDVAEKNDVMGRAVLDLSNLAREKTHSIDQPLEDGAGFIKLLVTISGTQGAETISDLHNYTPNPKDRENIVRKYGVFNSFKGLRDVGWLQVKVMKAQALLAADLGGKSDPFCVLELVNARLQTQTEYKTLDPEWAKIFTFNVKDIHSILEISVYDEDRDKKVEFLGRVSIPLLRIRNGDKKWYALKDRKLNRRSKGAILLEMDFIYNHIKAAVRTINPAEEKYMQPEPRFKIAVMKRNIDRVSKIIDSVIEGGKFIQSCFNWDSKARSITAFIIYLTIVWNFELYMAPLTLLLVFMFQLLITTVAGRLSKDTREDEYFDEVDDEDDDDVKDTGKDEKKSFKAKLHQVQEICLQVQEGMDQAASMGERVKNSFNWTIPWLSKLALGILFIATIILYYVPVRYLLLAWGVNKFTKKLRAPNAVPNNELLDYLSRVPSDKELMQYRELRPFAEGAHPVSSKKKRQ